MKLPHCICFHALLNESFFEPVALFPAFFKLCFKSIEQSLIVYCAVHRWDAGCNGGLSLGSLPTTYHRIDPVQKCRQASPAKSSPLDIRLSYSGALSHNLRDASSCARVIMVLGLRVGGYCCFHSTVRVICSPGSRGTTLRLFSDVQQESGPGWVRSIISNSLVLAVRITIVSGTMRAPVELLTNRANWQGLSWCIGIAGGTEGFVVVILNMI